MAKMNKLIILLVFIYTMQFKLANLATDESINGVFNNDTFLFSYICDDDKLLDIEAKMQVLVEENENLRLKLDTLTSSINLQFTKLETAISNLATLTKQNDEFRNSSSCVCSCEQIMDILKTISDTKSSQKSNQCSAKNISVDESSQKSNISAKNISVDKSSQQSNMKPILPQDLKPILPQATYCADALKKNGYKSGTYKINLPMSKLDPFFVYCLADPEQHDAPWTVIQRRKDGSVDFDRNWAEYQNGFGNLDGEFFIGLDKLHALTQSMPHELLIQLSFRGDDRLYSAKYSSFEIGDASEMYVLKGLGSYNGDASDYLRNHVAQKFYTKDTIGHHIKNCMHMKTQGGWWIDRCSNSNLNAHYPLDVYVIKQAKTGYYYMLHGVFTYVHMALRPVNKTTK